ncbi:MAG: hypothetical protein Greene041614_1208 [Parcubacteria group bacterium Greene0416_14]|nr:MAG: hypothetical protein Greene041614_1208 [Parcubacteria group bacterium Greene0416_14]TSC98975.1 MAG: hypothetical protein Greene101415_1213 [Parcubacteria group bacterium Greene1014_15]TSD06584.1 MAG: hypothetical protein Greene07144_1151 [Parcubacteria group bacterium Greene0714_4]
MFNFIEKLQQASLAKRKSIVLLTSTVLTLAIFGFWLMTFTRTNTSVVVKNTESINLREEQSASPFDAIIHAMKSIFDGSFQTYERK